MNPQFSGRVVRRFSVMCATVIISVLGNAGTARAQSFDPVTGKWFEAVLAPSGITWNAAAANAVAQGGYLACPTSAEENTFVYSLIDTPAYWTAPGVQSNILGPWLGAYSSNDLNGSGATWSWVDGEAFSYADWLPGQPDGYPGGLPAQAADYFAGTAIGATWGDTPQAVAAGFPTLPVGYVVEFNQNPVPEPSSLGLVGLGAAGILASRRRKLQR